MTNVAITTSDNPFNPFTEFDEWYNFDEIEKRYHTNSTLYRIARVSNGVPFELNEMEKERAIDFMIKTFPFITEDKKVYYVKVYKKKDLKFPINDAPMPDSSVD